MIKVIYSNQEDGRKEYLEFKGIGDILKKVEEDIINFIGSDVFETKIKAKMNGADQLTIIDTNFGNHHTWTILDDVELIWDTMAHTAKNFDGSEYSGENGLMKLNERLHEDGYYFPVEIYMGLGHTKYFVNPDY